MDNPLRSVLDDLLPEEDTNDNASQKTVESFKQNTWTAENAFNKDYELFEEIIR